MLAQAIVGAVGAAVGLFLYYRYRPPTSDTTPVSEAYMLEHEVRMRRQGLDPMTGEVPHE